MTMEFEESQKEAGSTLAELVRKGNATPKELFEAYRKCDAMELARLVREEGVKPGELLDIAIKQAEFVNPKINAVIHLIDEASQTAESDLPRGPFRGVPFLLKDLLAAMNGVPLSRGSKAYKGKVSKFDSEIVTRYKKAGLVIFGKTNTPEFGLKGVTDPEVWGHCRNPWNVKLTPGGSSGGSAAAVAAGIVPVAHGGDGGGSIRIPASHTGLFGLKPSRGRTPNGPDMGEIWDGVVVQHVISRSVRDSAAMLDVTQGIESGVPYQILPPKRPFLDEVKDKSKKTFKIAYSATHNMRGEVEEVKPECLNALNKAVDLLKDLGHELVEVEENPIDEHRLVQPFLVLMSSQAAAEVSGVIKKFDNDKSEALKHLELMTKILAALGSAYSAEAYVLAKGQWHELVRSMATFHQDFDFYLTPSVARLPEEIPEQGPKLIEKFKEFVESVSDALDLSKLVFKSEIAKKKIKKKFEEETKERASSAPFSPLANFTGNPAMSVPLHWTDDGIPVGVQFMAAYGREDQLFRLAGQLEKESPWFDQVPKFPNDDVPLSSQF